MAQSAPSQNTGIMPGRKSTLTYPDAISLDSDQRVESLHPSLPSIKIPKSTETQNSALLNPITLQLFGADELKTHNFVALKEQFKTADEARKAQEDAIKDLKERIEENERRTKEIEREMEEKEMTRKIERKIYMKKLTKESG